MRSVLGALLLMLSLAGCAEFTIVEATTPPTPGTLSLPPIGYNHRYGNSPLAAKDGFAMERALYADKLYWELAIRADPQKAGYVNLGDPVAVLKARHSITSLLVVIATEDIGNIKGFLAFGSHQAQESWCEALLERIRALGYDGLTSAQLLVFFTESDNHAKLTWSPSGGYAYAVFDHDLQGSGISPGATQTPLPSPPAP